MPNTNTKRQKATLASTGKERVALDVSSGRERERIEGVFHPAGGQQATDGSGCSDRAYMRPAEQGRHSVFSISRGWLWGWASAVPVGALLLASVPLLTAFEAHVVNVTAKIERRPASCDARSVGYWANHDGCSRGEGESIHAQKVREISQGLMGAFAHYTGAEICSALWVPNCNTGGIRARGLCRARSHTLADLSNIAAGLLDTSALIAAADDGTIAFDRLGLTPYSSVDEALTAIEIVILDLHASSRDLRHAAYVARRIYSFYEDENPFAPRCIYDPDDVPISFEGSSDRQSRSESDGREDDDAATSAVREPTESEDVVAAAAFAVGVREGEDDIERNAAGKEEDDNDSRGTREGGVHIGEGNSGADDDDRGRGGADRDRGGEEHVDEGGPSTGAVETAETTATTTATTTVLEESVTEADTEATTCEGCADGESVSPSAEGTPPEGTEEAARESEEPANTNPGPAEEEAAGDGSPASGTGGGEDGTGTTDDPRGTDADPGASTTQETTTS